MSKRSGKIKKSPAVIKNAFTPADTRFIKGFAILLLMWHHLCDNPDRYCYGTSFPAWIVIDERSLTNWFSQQGNISVTIFSFLGGLALYKCFERPNYLKNKLWSLYRNYWKIFFIFVPIGFLFFSNQEQYSAADYTYRLFENFNFTDFIRTLVGISNSYNIEWWFFFFYIKAIFIGLIFIYLNRRSRSCFAEIGELLLIMFVLQAVNSLSYNEGFEFLRTNAVLNDYFGKVEILICVLMGCIFGKYDLLPTSINWLHSLPIIFRKLIPIVTIIVILVCRSAVGMDYIFVPALIPVLYELFGYLPFMQKCMGFVGKHSGNMYYMHTFLIYYFGASAKLIYKPNNSFVSYIIFVAECLVLSVIINWFYGLLFKLGSKIHLFDCITFKEDVKPVVFEKEVRKETHEEIPGQKEKDEPEEIRHREKEISASENTITVDNYKTPVVCPGCKGKIDLGKQFGICGSCGIFFIKNKYRDDRSVLESAKGRSIVWIKKRKLDY